MNPARRRILLIVGLALALAVVLVGLGAFLAGGAFRGHEASSETRPASTSPAPTWAMTARPVPNEYGSYGQFTTEDVAKRWVIALYSWKQGEPQPAGMLSNVRDWTSDDLFAQMVSAKATPPGWAEQHAERLERTVNIQDISQDTSLSAAEDVVVVTFTVTDRLKDGTTKTGSPHMVSLRFANQAVQLPQDGGTTSITEVRVDSVADGDVRQQ